MDDKISKLYQAFVNEGYSMEPEDQFRQNLSDPAKRKAAYDALVSDGYNMEPFAEFETNIGFGKVEQAPAQTPTTNQAPEPQPTPTPSIPPAPTRLTYPTAPAPYLSNDKMYGPEMPTAADDEQPVEDAVPPSAWKPTEQQRIRIASDFAQVDAGMERMQASADRFNRFMAQFMPKERRQRKTEVAKKEVLTEASAGLDQLKARLSDAEGRLKELMQQREEEGQAASERPMSFLERLGASAAAANAGLHPTGAGAGLDKSPLDKSIEEASAEVMKLQQTISDYESRAGAADKSWLGKVGRGLASGITSPNTWTMGVTGASIAHAAHNADPSTESGRQLLESHIQAEELAAQSPDAGGFYEGGRFVGEMIGDPVTYASLGVGAAAKSVVTKGAAKVIGKGMAKDVAERYTANTLAGRLATRYGTAAAASGANFGTFEGLRDLRQQAMDGGYTDEEGNFHEGVSLNHAIREGGHGLIMGTTMGIFGAGMGNVGEIVVKGINSASGKAATRAAQHAVSVVGEGTIFAAPEIYDFQTMDDAKFDAQYAQHFGYAEVTDPKARAEARDAARNSLSWDAWGQSQANIAGMKIAGAMTHPAATVGHVKSVLDNLRTTDRRDHRSLGERIKAMTDRSPFDIAFTKDEAQEIRDAGYGDLANLFMRKGTGLVKAEDAGAGTSGYETVERLMEDPTVSEAARAKAYYVLTGHMLPMSTVTGYSTVENPDGRITVQSTNARGGVVTSRSFKDRKDAEREVSAIQRQAELNTVEVGENFREASANDAIFTAAVRRVSPGADPETVKQIYRDVRNGREGMTEDQQALADMIDSAIDFNDGADMRPDAIRRSIKDETGVDVDAALRKSANKRSEEEAEAVSTYMERLFDGAKLEEGQTSNPSAPGTPGDGAYQEGIQLYKRLSEAAETGDEQARGEAQADIDAIGLRMKEAYEAIEDAFGPDAEIRMAEMDDDPWALVNDPTLTVDQQDAVLYYINSKAAMDGVADAALESAERKRAEAAENIKRRTHRDSGMVQPAIMKIGDRQVYIAKGNVMMLDDGSGVDVANSDNSIIVFDPTTGEYEFTSPDRIFSAGEAIDPQTELTAANEAIDAEQTAIFNQQPIEEQPVEQPATENVPETPWPNVPAEVVPKSDESAPAEAETTVEGSETAPEAVSTGQTALSRVPLNEEGEPSFEAVDKDTAWDALVEVAGADAAAADIALAQTKSASEGLEALKGKKPTMKAPKLKGSPMAMARAQREATEKYQAELDTYNQQIADAQARFDAWSGIVGVYNTRSAEQRKQRQAEQEAADAQAHDEAVARFEEQQRVEAEKQAEQERVGTHAVNPKIKAKWDAANKIDGAPDAITLPDGSIMRGRYTLTEAGAASPSHDVINAYQPTEGFPVDANGQSVNDRDYMRDKEAQGIVERMAVAYDNRALQTPVIVSKDGVVLSGNNRTMSGDLAAQKGTDKAYVDYLREFGGKYGFTPEQVDGMKNPRVVFVPDEELPYDATTFSRFNAQEMKSQSKPEAAVKLGKIVPDAVFAGIVNGISRYDRLSDYYADEKAVAQALGALMQAGVINDKQMPELRTGTALSATGKELIENTLIGKVFQASPDAVRQIISMPSLRQPIVMGLNEVANNRALADADYDISKELAQAIDLVTRAKSAMPDIYTDGMPVSPFGRMQGLFDDEFGDSALTDGVALQLADVLNSGRPSDLRKWLSVYNHQAAEGANGQIDLFTGAVASKEDILTQVKEHFTNATPKEQQALINAAIAGRKQRSAEVAGQSGRGQASEQTADGAPGNSESQRVEPTEAQKAAGNYKKEHRRIDGYDISIENTKGSVRSGKDAGGKEWSITMHNDYGYIRGTEGVDGDHIDVFLSDTPKEGDVFVVDQVNKDGSFDEHKVMYGFPTKEAAREAYLSNYEEGWTGLGAITHVSRDEFKKWIASSHRKTKPFAEYKSIKAIEGNGMIGRSLTGQEATELIERMEATAEVAPTIELTPENWIAQFGEDGTVETPIGIVRMGANQLLKLYSTKRTGYFGMIHPTLSTPDAIFEEADSKEGSERDSKYLFVKTFVKSDGSRIVHFESVTVKKDGMEVSISSHEIKDKSLKNKMQNDIVLHLDEKLSPSSEMRLTEAPSESEGPDLVPTSDNVISSDRKDNTLSSDKQVVDEESSTYSITPTTYTNKANKTSDVYLVKFNRELSKEEKAALDTFARGLLTEGKKISRGWWDRKHGGYMMRSEETARQLAEMVGNEETIADAQPLSREDFTAEPRKKAPKAPNTVTTEDLAEAEAPKEAPAKGKFVVTDEMKAQEDELRKLLGIDDDEGSRDTYFRDPDELTPAQKRAVFKLGVEYAFNFLDNGVTSFPDFAQAVVGRLGAKVKPFIKSWYEGAKRVPDYGGEGYTETAEVDAFDIENFDKPTPDAIRDAAMRVAERKVAQAAEQAEKELIQDRNTNRKDHDKETETATAALAEKAEAIAGEAEAVASAASAGHAGRGELQQAIERVDEALDAINDQLALLGYYEAVKDESKYHESYGYMLTAEKKAVTDAANLAKQLVSDLGIDLKVTSATTPLGRKNVKKGTAVRANIAPAGGDVTIRLPLNEGRELAIYIGLFPIAEKGSHREGDNLTVERILYRVENPNGRGMERYGHNRYAPVESTYADFLRSIKQAARDYLPEPPTEKPTVHDNAVEMLSEGKKPSKKKATKVDEQQLIGDLFSTTFDNPNTTNANGKPRTEDSGSQRVAETERPNPVGDDAPRADGGIQPSTTDGTRDVGSAPAESEAGRAGTDGATHGPDEERGVQRPVGDRGRDESATDRGSDRSDMERRGTTRPSADAGQEPDAGAERVPEREPAAATGEGSRPTPVKKPQLPSPEVKYTRNFRYGAQGNEADSYTPAQRLEGNVSAIETLVDILFSGDPATDEQKAILSRFRGWGQVDLTNVYSLDFMERSDNRTLRRLAAAIKKLDPQNEKKLFEAIKRASLSAFYTPTKVAAAMNSFLPLAGFRGGNFLDPSMGNGIFEGTMPKEVQERTSITGVELDWLSGQISRALYPDAQIHIGGFEKSGLQPGSFDVVSTNVPFGQYGVNDPTWQADASPIKRAAQNRIHNYFAVKMLEETRPGGLVSMMTTPAIMDTKGNQNIRAHIADQGEILGAIRLPDNTFQGTGAVADIIFIRKWRDEDDRMTTMSNPEYQELEQSFLSLHETTAPNKVNGSKQKVSHNAYFVKNRKNMIGDIQAGNQYSQEGFGLTSKLSTDEIASEVEKAVKRIVGKRKGELYNPARSVREVRQAVREAFKGDADWVGNGNLVVQDGKVGVLNARSNEYGEVTREFEGTLKHDRIIPRVEAMTSVRTAMKKLIAAQIEGERDATLDKLRSELKTAYDAFVGRYGRLQDNGNAFILDDIDGYTMQALEVWKNGKFAGLSDIFTKNTIKPALRLDGAKTPQEAITTSLAEYGYVRPGYMTKSVGKDWAEKCGDLIFLTPNSADDYVTRDEYLSGDVVTKLNQAREAAKRNPKFEANVKALEEVQPATIPFDDIAAHLGARWIPSDVLTDFVTEVLGLHAASNRRGKWVDGQWVTPLKSGVVYVPELDSFQITIDPKELGGSADDWSTAKKSAKEILQAALEDKTVVIKNRDSEGNETVDEEQTELANQKIADLRDKFEEWLPGDPNRVELIERAYNDRFNRTVIRKFDGSHLVVPGLMGKELRPHQKDAVWMLINNRGGIVDHIVGAGKTLVMQSAIMEMRRMGIAKKPMIVALKSTVSQIAREFKEAFPSARVLAPNDSDFQKANRKKFIANISLNDYDCVILSHEQYCMLPHTEEAERDVINEQLWQLDNMIEYLYGAEDQSQMTKRQIKALEKRRENLIAKLEKRLDRNVDREFCFENLGVDYLFVDECHQFKSLPYVTSYNRVAGLGDTDGSSRAVALLTGVRHLQKMHQGDKGTIFLSGTTITNSLVEIYNLLNYLRPRELQRLGMPTFDAWASTFAVHSSELEAGTTGTFATKDRFRSFDNVPELSALYAEIADVRNDQNLKLPKPGIHSETHIVPASAQMEEINHEIVYMLNNKDGKYFGIYPKDPSKAPWGLHASTISAKAAVSPRLVFPDWEDEGGKVHAVCEQVSGFYKDGSEYKGVQLIFCEMGVPGKDKKYDAYNDIRDRLANDYGIPRKEIAFIQEAPTEEKRKELFQNVRDGKIRILIGGTKNMGTGVNVQDRITDMHMLTVPWTPSALEQCIGRGGRQGNIIARDFLGNKVRVHYYATEGSLDLYKYQLLDAKGKMFTQFKMGTVSSGNRSFDEGSADEDGNMDPAEMVAILSGNPVIFEKAKQEKLVKKLRNLRNGFEREYQRKKSKLNELTTSKEKLGHLIRLNEADRKTIEKEGFVPDEKGAYSPKVIVRDGGAYYGGRTFDKPKEAGQYIHKLLEEGKQVWLCGYGKQAKIVTVNEEKDGLFAAHREVEMGDGRYEIVYRVPLSDDDTAAGTAFRNLMLKVINNGDFYKRSLADVEAQLSGLNIGDGTFPKQKELDEAQAKLKELTAEYNKLGKSESNSGDTSKTRFRLVEAGPELDFLNSQPLKIGYRYAQWAKKARSYMDAYESSNEAKAARAEYLSANLGVPIKVISDEPDMAALPSNRHRRAKGWWSEGEGIVVALPNNVNVADVDNTVVHEMVGHYGLRKLVGTDRFDNFLDEVYNHASDAVRAKIDAMEEKIFNGETDKMRRAKSAEREQAGEDVNAHFVGDTAEAYAEAHKHRQAYRREATEEYMSDLAGRVGSEGFAKMEEEELNIWGKIKAAVQRLLDNFLKRLNIPKSIKLTDKHLQYILYKSWRNLKDRHADKADVFSQAEDAMMRARTGYNDVERFRDGDMSLEETIIKMKTEAAQANADNWKVKRDAMKAIGGNLNHLRQAMARQREYDLTTVKSITDLAKILLDNNMLDDLSKYETKRILSTVNNVLGRQDVSKYVQKVMDIMVDNQLRLGANALGHLLSIRGKRVDARGIEVQGELDPEGQMISQAMRKSMSLPKDAIEMKIAEAVNLMGSPDAAVADQAAIEYSALLMAHQYVEDITESKAEEKELRASIHEAKADKDAGKITAQAYSQYVKATEDAIRQNKIERAEAYRDIVERIGGVLGESVERAKAWREAEKQRVEEIHHNANSDMEGRPTDEHHKNNRAQNLANNSGVRFLLAPLATFDQMLRMFGRKNSRGEGYLWNRYMRGWVDATEREYLGYKSALKTLDEKVKEIFKDSKDYKANSWGDLFSVDRKLPKAYVRFWDGGEMKEHELTQGNLLYIYMVDMMNDGRMKLRSMGITEENVEDIKNFLNPRFMQLADWMQDEFLVDKRNEYNEVHKRMFGASMAAIENYFPLKILANARLENVDVADDTTETALPATSTGSIIKRRRNNLALDVTGANAFSVILDHIQQMERWAAFAEFNRDLNTLLSYKRFRNQVMNMTSAYGGGKTLWNNFRNVCSMAAGAYRPPIAALDKAAVNIAKGVTAAKVSFRVFTALKQFLSMPAYLSDSNPVHLATNLINPVGAWKWSMKNLPLFEKRWSSRMAGDPRLLKSEMDWKMWRSRIVEIASRIGMSPNALVDALTVAIGSHSMYQTKLDKYKRQGYAPDVAEERAKQDATILFNQTQQSSESAFLSTMQVDRSWLSVLFTVFRNSSMSYTRQLYDAIRNIGHRFTPGYKGLTEEFMAKQMRRDGIDPDKADRNAKQEYRRGIIRDLVRVGVFGAAMQFAWNLGAYLPYLILGKDDDEKAKMWDDVMNHTMFGSIEGLTGGDVISAAGQMWANGEGNPEYLAKDMPLASDVLTILKKMDKDQLSAMNDVINLLVQSGIGVNPQTLTDAAVAIIDACGDDAQTSRECALLIARILNCPQSQIDKIYFDELHATGEEASKMSPSEIADRYARYKIRRGAPLTGWAYGDEKREELMEKYRKPSNTIAKERLSRDTDNAISPKMAELREEYKATQERVSKLNKLKEHDEDRYNELFDELWDTPEYQRYEIIKDYKHDIDDLTKQWFNATTKEERDSCARLLIEAKREMVEQINQVQQ